MQFYRLISERIRSLANAFPVVVLTGARQVGKTTLLRHLFPGYNYVSLDLYSEAELAEQQPEQFLQQHPPPLLVDEVQYAPKLFRHVKVAVDANRARKGQFILTGSQKFSLMKEVSDSLAGRCAILELEGVAYEEVKDVFDAVVHSQSLEVVLARGMFPELWANSDIPAHDFYRSYLASYLERDVRQILNVTSLRDFERFIRACAARSGQLLNKTELARDVGVSQKTITDWLSVLEASNQIALLEPYFGNVGKRLVKTPRLFFCDPGLLCFLLGLSEDSLPSYHGLGHIWETFVYAELRKLKEVFAIESSLWFYRDSLAREVDFVLARGGKLSLFEVKWTEIPTRRDVATLEAVAQTLGAMVKENVVLCHTRTRFPITAQTQAVSAFALRDMFTGPA